MSSGVRVAVLLAFLVVAVTAKPGGKGGGNCHVKYVPIYHTVYNKVRRHDLFSPWCCED